MMIKVSYRDNRVGLDCEELFVDERDAKWLMKEVNVSDNLRGISVEGTTKYFCGPSGVFYHDTRQEPARRVD